jgi:hypothetical protein
MRRIIVIVCLLHTSLAYPQLLINEIACNVPAGDWVELFYCSEQRLSMDISSLYVTMYYGTNEPLSQSPVTIYSYDRAETPWDDRFVVVHCTKPGIPDECDATGDTNGNGVLDVYCNNYINSLWNTDCVVAIDSDDEPSNGGIIDFVAYANRDGTLNQSIEKYLKSAIDHNQWVGAYASEECMVDIGQKGILEYQSIIRKNGVDTNSADDFVITSYQTPGRPNILPINHSKSEFIKIKRTIVISKKNMQPLQVFAIQPCKFRIRLFSSVGYKIYESPLINSLPGVQLLDWTNTIKHLTCGLYLGIAEAQDNANRESKKFYCIVVE